MSDAISSLVHEEEVCAAVSLSVGPENDEIRLARQTDDGGGWKQRKVAAGADYSPSIQIAVARGQQRLGAHHREGHVWVHCSPRGKTLPRRAVGRLAPTYLPLRCAELLGAVDAVPSAPARQAS